MYGDGKSRSKRPSRPSEIPRESCSSSSTNAPLPKVDLKDRDGLGIVSKLTTYAYDAAGHLAAATTVMKLVELDSSKPVKNSKYPLKRAEQTVSSTYQTAISRRSRPRAATPRRVAARVRSSVDDVTFRMVSVGGAAQNRDSRPRVA